MPCEAKTNADAVCVGGACDISCHNGHHKCAAAQMCAADTDIDLILPRFGTKAGEDQMRWQMVTEVMWRGERSQILDATIVVGEMAS